MNQIEASKIVIESIMVKKPGFSLLTSATKEFLKCFVFYCQNDSYIKSGDLRDMSVGQGPIIVCKSTGKCFETGSAFSTEEYVKAFEVCGDPYGQPMPKVLILSWVEGANAVKAITCVKNISNINLAQAKSYIDTVLNGGQTVIDLESVDKVESLIQSLSQFGFNSKQVWSTQR